MYFSKLKNWPPICQGAWSPKSCQEFLHQYRFWPIFEATRHAAGQGQRADGGIEALKSSIDLFWGILLPWIWIFCFRSKSYQEFLPPVRTSEMSSPLTSPQPVLCDCQNHPVSRFRGKFQFSNLWGRFGQHVYLLKKDTRSIHLESYPHLFFSFNPAGPESGCGQETQLARCRETYRGSTHVKNGFISLSYMSKYSFGTCEYMSQHFRLYCYTVYTSICFSIVGLHCHCPSPSHSFTPAKSLGGFVNIYVWILIM